jgi:hypothetical protein
MMMFYEELKTLGRNNFLFFNGMDFKTSGRICTLGQKRNSDIRQKLSIFNINDKLTQYKINWKEHI